MDVDCGSFVGQYLRNATAMGYAKVRHALATQKGDLPSLFCK